MKTFRIFPLFIVIVAVMALLGSVAHADLTWQTPLGTIGLPLTATEALVGYDGVLKQSIAGFSLPVYTDPKQFVALQVGAVAPWQTNGATIQPYLALGHDLAREIPFLAEYKSFHINAFGRYDPSIGRAGAGIGVSYGFGGGTLTAPATTTP